MSRKTKKNGATNYTETKNHFELSKISPKTKTQATAFEEYKKGRNLFLHGYAGTGKSFISLYLSLQELLTGNSTYDKIVIIRSVVPSRDIGALPGSIEEKAKIYEEPYRQICDNLFGRGDGYQILKMKKLIIFETTSFLRGQTFDNAILIVDEVQNMNAGELHTVMTRVGENSRIIFSGDFRQTDLRNTTEKQGLVHFINVIKSMKSFEFVEFNEDDIVRSGVVREYIIAEARYKERLVAA